MQHGRGGSFWRKRSFVIFREKMLFKVLNQQDFDYDFFFVFSSWIITEDINMIYMFLTIYF